MLLRTAKLAGFLRILIPQIAPIVATTIGSLSLRAAIYLIGFAFGSVLGLWLPIVATLVSVTGAFNSTSTNTQCEAYRAEMRRIEAINIQRIEAYRAAYKAWYDSGVVQAWSAAKYNYETAQKAAAYAQCELFGTDTESGALLRAYCFLNASRITYPVSPPSPPPYPQLLSFTSSSGGSGGTGFSGANCPPGKKVWLQVIWASVGGKASDSKGCFLIAYSQQAYNVAPVIEYNPFTLPVTFIRAQALSYFFVKGDKFRGLNTTEFKNLESVQGWDKGYWMAEAVDVECRGWRPGWSRKVK